MEQQHYKLEPFKHAIEHPDFVAGTKVEFILTNDLSGTGKIVGIATNGDIIIGKSYIIELDKALPNCNYTCIVCPELNFDVIE
jgi:hypothetical protein